MEPEKKHKFAIFLLGFVIGHVGLRWFLHLFYITVIVLLILSRHWF